MKLSKWIASEGGREIVARRLGVTVEALHYWVAGKNVPRLSTMRKIQKMSKGKVTLLDILGSKPWADRKRSRK